MNRWFPYGWRILLALFPLLVVGCSRDPNVAKQRYVESGQRYFQRGKYREAVIQLRNAIQIDAAYGDAHYKLAQSYLKLQEWTPAYNELSRTIELEPANYTAHLDLLNLLIAGHELRQAKVEKDWLIQNQPERPEVHIASADFFIASEDIAAASAELTKAITLEPRQSDPYERLAGLEMRSNQPQLAEENLKKAIQINPNAVSSLLALASYYQSQDRFPEAEQDVQRAIAASPDSPEPRADLVRLYMSEGRRSDAERLAKQVSRDFSQDPAGYRMLGDFYFAVGEIERALSEYSALYQRHPADILVKKNYTQLLIVKDRLGDADTLDREILKANPRDQEGLIDRAQIELRNGDAKASADTLQRVISDDPSNGLAYYHLGLAFDRLGNFQQAVSAWQNAVRHRPELSDAHMALAQAAVREGDMPALEQSAGELIRLMPASPQGYAMRAFSYTARGQFDRAEQDATDAIRVAPQDSSGYLQMGNLCFARKRYAEAESFYHQALDRDPASFEAVDQLMKTYLVQNQRDKAIEVAQAAITKNPNSSALYDLLGTAEFGNRNNLSDMEAAESHLKNATKLDKSNTDAWLKLAQVQSAKGSADGAFSTIQQALQQNPREAPLYLLEGQLYEAKRDFEKAKDCYQQVLQMEPRQPVAANNLAYLLTRTGGNLDLALSLAQTARRGMPDSYSAADTLGWVLYEKGAYRSAIDSFQDAVKLAEKGKSPVSPTLHFHLGLAYEKTGEIALAREHLEQVLKINPHCEEADDVRQLLGHLRG